MQQDALNGEPVIRAQNFYWNTKDIESKISDYNHGILDVEKLLSAISAFCKTCVAQGCSQTELLNKVFLIIYEIITRAGTYSCHFYWHTPSLGCVYEAYMFTALCTFLHTSKRIPRRTIKDFVYENNPLRFNRNDSPRHESASLQQNEVEKFMKARFRRLQNGHVYMSNMKHGAMAKDSEYEWMFYYDLQDADPIIRDTEKRIGNLYNGLRKVLCSKIDYDYGNRVQKAYQKFVSQLRKIEYRKYLELQKVILSRICEDKKYYGINLYRLERRLKPYTIINEVKKLEKCQSPEQEAEFLWRTVELDEICFPKIYEYLWERDADSLQKFANAFPDFFSNLIILSCLVLDQIVENGFLGEAWESLFLDTTNRMAESVLYDPQKIDFDVSNSSQEKFLRVLHAGVFMEVNAALPADDRSRVLLEDLLI